MPPLPRSWAEAACHPAIESIQLPVDGERMRWVTMAEPWVAPDQDGYCFPVYDFRELQYILKTATQDTSNERRVYGAC